MNGGLRAALTTAAKHRHLERRPSPSGSPDAVVGRARAGAPGIVVLLERERAVVAAEQLVDEASTTRSRNEGRRPSPGTRSRVLCGVGEQRFDHAAHPHRSGDVVHAHDPAAVQDAVRDGRERRRAPVVDVESSSSPRNRLFDADSSNG